MILPEHILGCLERLERSGFPCWAVGGCVRDACLGQRPKDYDLCTPALPEQTEQVFSDFPLVFAGKKHGTIGVVTSGGLVEITTFRTEGPYTDNRRPDWVAFVPELEQDLARRDYTINAMAYSPSRGLSDPFGGRADLQQHVLRAVGDPEQRFREDSLRILRGVRFSVKYSLCPDSATEQAMFALAPLMDNLAQERIFSELCGILLPARAEDLLRFAPVLAQVIPELRPTIGFDQRSPHHAYSLFAHIAHVTAGVEPDLTLRWAALLHDIGKVPTFTLDETGRGHFYGHAQVSARMAGEILLRLKAPKALRESVTTLIDKHMLRLMPDRKLLSRQVQKLGFDLMYKLLSLQEADMSSKGTGVAPEMEEFSQVRRLLDQMYEDCRAAENTPRPDINGHDLMALGLQGKAIGQMLQWLKLQVLSGQLKNEKSALLRAAEERMHKS